ALAQIPTDQARKAILDRFVKGGIMEDLHLHVTCQDAMGQIGAPMVPLIKEKLPSAPAMTRFELVTVLGKIHDPTARELAEAELQGAPVPLRRPCYLAIGHLGYKESEPVLLKELAGNDEHPDDALVWAVGRCGTQKSVADVRRLLSSTDAKVRLAAIAASGNVGDAESIPDLIKL